MCIWFANTIATYVCLCFRAWKSFRRGLSKNKSEQKIPSIFHFEHKMILKRDICRYMYIVSRQILSNVLVLIRLFFFLARRQFSSFRFPYSVLRILNKTKWHHSGTSMEYCVRDAVSLTILHNFFFHLFFIFSLSLSEHSNNRNAIEFMCICANEDWRYVFLFFHSFILSFYASLCSYAYLIMYNVLDSVCVAMIVFFSLITKCVTKEWNRKIVTNWTKRISSYFHHEPNAHLY